MRAPTRPHQSGARPSRSHRLCGRRPDALRRLPDFHLSLLRHAFDQLLAPMGLEFSSTGQTASFPFGARLSDVRLTSTRPASAGLLVESPAVTIAPALPLDAHASSRRPRQCRSLRRRRERHDPPQRRRHRYQLRPRLGRLARQQLWTHPRATTRRALFPAMASLLLSPDDIDANRRRRTKRRGTDVHVTLRAVSQSSSANADGKFTLDRGILTIEELKTSGGDLILTPKERSSSRPIPAHSDTRDPIHAGTGSRCRRRSSGYVHIPAASPRPANPTA